MAGYQAGVEPLPVREVRETKPLDDLLVSPDGMAEMRVDLMAGDAFIVPRVIDAALAGSLIDWLRTVGRSSLPGWHPITEGAPNHHRMNRWDERAHVYGCFHQFSFFPWNQDPFDLFARLAPVYALKNILSGLEPHAFLGHRPQRGCTARLSIQCYPAGGGELESHSDPVDHHQLTVPSILLSPPGDVHEGGLFVIDETGATVNVDALTGTGDALFFNARAPHGVAPVDPDRDMDWLAFEGRWAMVVAVNRLADNDDIADSRGLETQP